jgi:hypothetical protein
MKTMSSLLPDETNLNHTLVKEGWCWWYRKYAPGAYGAGRVGKGSTRRQEGVVGSSVTHPTGLSQSEAWGNAVKPSMFSG